MPPRRIKLPLNRNAQARVPPRSNQGPSDDEEIAAKKAKGGEEAEEEASNARSGSGDRAGKKKNKHSRSVLPGEGGGLSARSIEFHRVKRELLVRKEIYNYIIYNIILFNIVNMTTCTTS